MKTILRFLIVSSLFISHISFAQWTQTSLDTLNVTTLAINGTNLFAGTPNGAFLSANKGDNWIQIINGLTTTNVLTFAVSDLHILTGTFGGGVFHSTDNGTHWTAENAGLTIPNVNALAMNNSFIYAGVYDYLNGGGVYRSLYNGFNWNAINNGLTNSDVRALVVKDTNIFAGTVGGVFLSTNNGDNWITKNVGLTTPYVVTLAVSGTDIFAGTITGGIFLSTDDGNSWNVMNFGLTNLYINAFAVLGNKTIFAGTGWSGVFLTTNNGLNWSSQNNGLTTSQINALIIGSDSVGGTYLYAGTDHGVWRRSIAEMVTGVVKEKGDVPDQFSLQQNYPNPFNPSTVIKYQIPVNTFVSLKVFDLLGHEVATLVNEEKVSGVHFYELGINDYKLSSGVYFYQLRAGELVKTMKMVILK